MNRPDYLNSENKEPVAKSIPAEHYRATGQEISTDAMKVLRNTYALLAMTLVFSAAMAGISMVIQAPSLGMLTFVVGMGLIFAINATRNSVMGLVLTFVFTGFMGFTLGPLLNMVAGMSSGGATIALALGGTGMTFLLMTVYGISTKRDLSGWSKMLFAGFAVAIIGGFVGWIFEIPALSLAISAIVIPLSAALISFETNNIVRGGETNYIMATVTLFVAIYNIFHSLLLLLGIFGSDD
jgi:modulator of FtsH protease